MHPCAVGGRSRTSGTPSSSKSSVKTSSVREWPASFKPRIHPFAGMCHNTALDPAKLERSTARPSCFAGIFLCVCRGVLVQLRFDDVRCFGRAASSAARTLGLECGTCLARGKDAAPIRQSSGSQVRPRPSRLRHRRSLAARPSCGITRRIRYTEQLSAGAAAARPLH